MTVDKNVPEVRFKGFGGEWAEKELGEITSKIGSGKTPKGGDSTYVLEGVPLIRSQNIYNNLVNLKNIAYITPQTHADMKNSSVFKNDVLLNITGASIGRSAVYAFSSEANVNQHVCIIRLYEGYNSAFTQLHLTSTKGQQLIDNNQAGGAREGLNFQQIGRMNFSFASKEEQTQIGNTFQKLDSLINQHQQKHDKLCNIKKAMLEKMFPKQGETIPEIRFKGFSGEWLNNPIGEICGTTFGGGTPSTNEKSFWQGQIPWIQSSDIKDGSVSSVAAKKYITKAAVIKSATKLISGNSIAIVTRVGVGKLSLMESEYATSQDFLSLSDLKIKAQYAVYVIWKQLQSEIEQVQGTSIKGITKDELLGKLISYPKTEDEQTKIGYYFQKLDALINQHQQQITKLNNIKQACLSKMFV